MKPEDRKRVARLGGLKISQDRKHMSELGKLGGAKVSADAAHMAAIGRLGGAAGRGKKRKRKAKTHE